tara:strand:+ start:33 stop:215 length:183 start_codon:yes stop_codon:yes gene_type:complete
MNLGTNRRVIQTILKNVQQNINKFGIGKDNHERVLLPVLEDIFKTSIRVVVFVKVYNIKG